MYYFGMDKIIKDLQTGKISSDRQLWYLIIGGGGGVPLLARLFDIDFFSKNYWNNISGLSTVQMATIALVALSLIAIWFGFLNCYWINQKRDNQDFILRYMVLSATIIWRLFAVFISIYLVASFILPIGFNQLLAVETTFLRHVVVFGVILLFYGLMNLAFAKVAGKK